jgi:hypothetical protein
MAREVRSRSKKVLLVVVGVIVVAFIGIQFWRLDTTPVPIVQADTIQAGITVPPDVDMVLTRSCGDCHSNQTVYPWYSQMQPVAWWLANHIAEGRQELNFSTFNTYNSRRKEKKLEAICDQVKSGEMPLPSYTWVHRDAILTESEKDAICKWTETATREIKDDK